MADTSSNSLSRAERIKAVLLSWNGASQHLKYLTPAEILEALRREKARAKGPRMNIAFRLAQRYDSITKNKRMQDLLK